ncbi:hypothetical protein, partial [Streptomyces prunicolor]|uniref:hypothetical protein n=1 Tax=Streptomyces prunicolor TaxID=67348 RepID=UPI0033D23ED3
MSMEYRMRRTLPSDRVAIIMPVDHGLIFNRIEGLETPSGLRRQSRGGRDRHLGGSRTRLRPRPRLPPDRR